MLTPLQVGNFKFKNRLVMPGMTRCRSDPLTGVPNDLVKEYYIQRAESAALIISESMPVNGYCNPWPGSAAVWNEDALPAWKGIIDAIHKKNSYIFAQLSHGGRLVHPDLAGGRKPLSSSAIKLSGEAHVPSGKKPYETPEAMTNSQIQEVINDFSKCFQNAKKAGFDGIEINGGSGLLIDQFIQSGINHRFDEYGGSVKGRCRFALEIVDEALKYWDAKQIGIKISIVGRSFDSYDENPQETLAYLLPELDRRGILYINMVEAEDYIPENNGSLKISNVAKEARKHWKRTIITNGFTSLEERSRKIADGEADLVAFARVFIANPDLALRLKNSWPLAEPDQGTFFFGGEKGFTDYPKYIDPKKSQAKCGCTIF